MYCGQGPFQTGKGPCQRKRLSARDRMMSGCRARAPGMQVEPLAGTATVRALQQPWQCSQGNGDRVTNNGTGTMAVGRQLERRSRVSRKQEVRDWEGQLRPTGSSR